MANNEEIKAIELRRLAELEKQRAFYGVDCAPRILLEIADLRAKYGIDAVAVSRDANPETENRQARTVRDLWNEVDFLRAICAAALREFAQERALRRPHQRLMMVWMGGLSAGLVFLIYLVMYR